VLTGDQLRQRIVEYVAAVNSRDPRAIAAQFTADAFHADPVSNPPNLGRTAIATFFEAGIAASDDWTFMARAVHTCAPSVAVDFAITVLSGGATMAIEGVEVFVVDDDGLFQSVHAYWDESDLSFT